MSRLCIGKALKAAVVGGEVKTLYASAFLRYERRNLLFCVVGTANELKAVTFAVRGKVERDKITLSDPTVVNTPAILERFQAIGRCKREVRFTDIRETDLRRLASHRFPGSLFYDVYINPDEHVFSALPPVDHEQDEVNATEMIVNVVVPAAPDQEGGGYVHTA